MWHQRKWVAAHVRLTTVIHHVDTADLVAGKKVSAPATGYRETAHPTALGVNKRNHSS